MEHINYNWYDRNMIPLLPNNDDPQSTAYYMDNLNLSEISKHPPPLGLKLTLTPDMLPLTEQKKNAATAAPGGFRKVDKLKAVHFTIYMLTIGAFKIEAKYPADLVAKFYYAKRKLVWEILRDGLKEKIEIQWKNITAIRAVLQENLPGILEIQLEKVPSFFREIEPKPGKHTVWTISHDFTHSQASKYQRHHLQFPPGVLDQYYAKLLQCDNRLLELSQRPFPTSHATYFDSYLDQRTTQLNFSHHSSTNTQQQFVISNTPTPLTSDEEAINNNQMFQDPMLTSQGFHYDTLLSMESVARAGDIHQNGTEFNYELPSDVSNMLQRGGYHHYHIPEIEFDPSVGQSIEESLVYNANTTYTSTQIDWSLLTQ